MDSRNSRSKLCFSLSQREDLFEIMEYLKDVPDIVYGGPDDRDPLKFKHYRPEEMIEGKKMEDHLKFAICFWHTMRGNGGDPFGEGTIIRKWDDGSNTLENAVRRVRVFFAILEKLGVRYYCFHDRDVAPEGKDLEETNRSFDEVAKVMKSEQERTGIKCLWATSCLFANKRYMSGAATNPDLNVFSYAAAQVKKCLDIAVFLGAEHFVFWGGREGYSSLLNTNLRRELDHYANFLKLAQAYKRKIGFKGTFFIEPKPREPSKHQYDFDASTVIGFLKTYGLEKDFKLNIECNHATLAARSFHHEVLVSSIYGFLGSIDANDGDYQCGWDTDYFPSNVHEITKIMTVILNQGGLEGGLNFDAKLRRESTDLEDIFIAHVLAMDSWALGLKNAVKIRQEGILKEMKRKRYETWDSELGKKVEMDECSFEELEKYIMENEKKIEVVRSGKQEKFESIFNTYIFK